MRLHDVLDYQARQRPHGEFVRHRGRSLTFGAAVHECERLASAFVTSGLATGDRVAFVSKNCIEHVLVYFAASMAGVVPVPLNFRLPAEQWRTVINDAGARMVIAAGEYAPALDALREELGTVERFIGIGGTPGPAWTEYQDLPAGGTVALRPASADDPAYILYTSGTTGDPKGAVITHRSLVAHMMQVTAFYGAEPHRRILVVTPLSHVHAAFQAFICACWGSCLCILDAFDPAEMIRTLVDERIAIAVVVPSMIRACLTAVPDIETRRFDDLRLMHYGAAPIAENTLRRAVDVFRCDFVQGYGMTETTAGVTFLLQEDHRRALAGNTALLRSAGRAALGNEVRVANERDESLPPGTVGEIIVRGPTLMRGYWQRPAETAQALRNGWMHTGDLGWMDQDGYLYVVDRASDAINSGGENVYPRMVEEVLLRHPAVADAAAIGVPDERWGETVKATVVLHSGYVATAADLLTHCGEHLAGFQRPRSLEFRDALPYNASGKLLRRMLREPYWTGRERRVGAA